MQRMVNGGTVNSWICINFSRTVQDSVARSFCHELAQMCSTSGMVNMDPKDACNGYFSYPCNCIVVSCRPLILNLFYQF